MIRPATAQLPHRGDRCSAQCGQRIACPFIRGASAPADRRLVPLLRARGDVVTMDHRGLGASDVGFATYTPEDSGRDLVALVSALRLTRVVFVVCSMSGASALWACTELPAGTISGVVFISPFNWDHDMSAFVRFQLWAFIRPWCGGARIWADYYRSLHPLRNVDDLESYCAALEGNLAQAGRLDAVRAQIMASKASCEARLPAFLTAHIPYSVVYGSRDRDFPDVAAEAREFTARYTVAGGEAPTEVVVFEGVGHYPHTERTAETMAVIDRLLAVIARRAAAVKAAGATVGTASDASVTARATDAPAV